MNEIEKIYKESENKTQLIYKIIYILLAIFFTIFSLLEFYKLMIEFSYDKLFLSLFYIIYASYLTYFIIKK